jgi:chorismate dehydratase
LGQVWNEWTGLPFVFAVWVARNKRHLDRLDRILTSCRDAGVAHLEAIAGTEAAKYDLTQGECLEYLRDHLHFYFGPQEKLGLDLFFQLAAEQSLLPAAQIQFHACQTA